MRLINLSNNHLGGDPYYRNMPNLVSLDLSYNDNLYDLTIENCPKLETLIANNNVLPGVYGIELLDNLKYIDLSYNNISVSIGINHLEKLEYIDLSYNDLTGDIVLSNKNYLKEAYFAENNLTNIDLSNNPLFTSDEVQSREHFDNNENLESIDISGCPAFIYLFARYMKLQSVNIEGCESILKIDVSENNLASLDISQCPDIIDLRCNDNVIEYLDFNLDKLNYVNAENNNLNVPLSIDGLNSINILLLANNNIPNVLSLTDKPSLIRLSLANNNLISIKILNCVNLDDSENAGNHFLGNPLLVILHISGCTAYQKLVAENMKILELRMDNCSSLGDINVSGNEIGNTNIPVDTPQITAGRVINFHDNDMTTDEVDYILLSCNQAGIVNTEIYLDGNNAAPSPERFSTIASLESRGCTVYVNGMPELQMIFDVTESNFSSVLKFKWANDIELKVNWADGSPVEQFTNDTDLSHT
ncbi:MAG: hypothetical protein GY756_23710 [bacterium]|nr:hypothetical protein [bacterium]